MTKNDLISLANSKGLKTNTKMTKAELETLISNNQATNKVNAEANRTNKRGEY